MKISMITDLHFGTNKSSEKFLASQMKFFEKQYIPYLKENDIDTIVIGGDVFDSRNSINVKIINSVYNFFELLEDFKVYVILGNHDIYYKTTTDINSLKVFSKFDNVTIVDDITKIDNMLLVAWQTDEAKFTNYIIDNNIKEDICIGHFDINGFKQTKYKTSDAGFSTKVFENFDIVFSGHFHLRDEQHKHGTKFIYIGSPYHLDRNDIDTKKGFCILDTETLEFEFIDNIESIEYVSIRYPEEIIEDDIKNNIVDVHIDYDSNYDEIKFKEYLSKIDNYNPLDSSVKLINNFLSGEEIEDLDDYSTSNIEEIMREYISKLNVEQEEQISKTIFDLYDEVKEI